MNPVIGLFVNILVWLYEAMGNFGWAVVVVTVAMRLIMLPLLWPSLKAAKKMKEVQPKLKKLQEKYKDSKEKLAKAQMDLYKTEGVNPLSGCLPQILQIAVLIMFFSAFNLVSQVAEGKKDIGEINQGLWMVEKLEVGHSFNLNFLGSDLAVTPAMIVKDGISWSWLLPAILLLGSGLVQFLSAKMMNPNSPKIDESKYVKATKEKSDDIAETMRMQSTYMMPLMTIIIGWSFSLGILLYWFVNSVVMWGQQLLAERLGKR